MIPKITVVMPIYNVKHDWLRESIDSILNQTFKEFELLIIDDGSTNGSDEVYGKYKVQDSRIRTFRFEKNRGVIAAMNHGILQAKANIIANQDGDDISVPDRLEKQYQYLMAHPDVIVVSTQLDYFFTDYELKENERDNFDNYFNWYNQCLGHRIMDDLIKRVTIANAPSMYYRDKCIEAGLYREGFALIEEEVWYRMVHLGKLDKYPEPLYIHRVWNGSLSHNNNWNEIRTLFAQIQAEYFNKIFKNTMRIAVWGLGKGGQEFLEHCNHLKDRKLNIVIVADKSKAGEKFNEYTIQSPETLVPDMLDKVIVTISSRQVVGQIKTQLLKQGFSLNDCYFINEDI